MPRLTCKLQAESRFASDEWTIILRDLDSVSFRFAPQQVTSLVVTFMAVLLGRLRHLFSIRDPEAFAN